MSAVRLETELFDQDRIEAIASRMDLRTPNKEALESIVYWATKHYEIDREPPPFEGVVDLATGVGKTYVLAAGIEYYAAEGVRNFAVITPGRTILNKTEANFTPGNRKSLMAGMETRPVVITSENFATPAMRAAMEDTELVKLFIFTVQALLKPETKLGRKTHKFQEGLGEAFYAHLQGLRDLVVFADEHHTYYGPAFSRAIRDLVPHMLIGLTATPSKKTPVEDILYRYPLAAAIAEKLVKTPVLVGRRDLRRDPETKLMDGVRLLELKEQLVERWCANQGRQPITPVMLVIAPSIAEAEEIQSIVRSDEFLGGRYADKVLTVHSDAPDEALAQLDRLEDPDNPYWIVVSVGMLKEGWDVKNVYVIASLRASVSDILTEQTLGRGMRLPFGAYTGVELLDTLEVLGHERYEELLKRSGALNETFIDVRTRSILQRDLAGNVVPVRQTIPVQASLAVDGGAGQAPTVQPGSVPLKYGFGGGPVIRSVEEHTQLGENEVLELQHELAPRADLPKLQIPVLRMTDVKNEFSLSDITDLEPFRRQGEKMRADPVGTLKRVILGATLDVGPDGIRRTVLDTRPAMDAVASPALPFPLEDTKRQLLDRLLGAPVVPARANQRFPVQQIVNAYIEGLGDAAQTILSGYLDRAAADLIRLVTVECGEYASRPVYSEVVELMAFNKVRASKLDTTHDLYGDFRGKKGVGFEGFRKSLYAQDWFDSSTERDAANLLDVDSSIVSWVRLQIGDLPILWNEARQYNPDFIAVDTANEYWVIEVKADKEMASPDVQGKREAALRWANYVSADEQVSACWRYLLVCESDVAAAKGSWVALKAAGGQP